MKNQAPGQPERRWQTLAAAAASGALSAVLFVTTCPAPTAAAQPKPTETSRIVNALEGIDAN